MDSLKYWTTEELKEWVDNYESTQFLRNKNNLLAYKEAINHLFARDGGNYFYKYFYYNHINKDGDYNDYCKWKEENSWLCKMMVD